jgi:hypothetical protein
MNHDTIAQLQMQTNIMHVALDHAHRLMHIRRHTVRLALVLSIHLVVQLTVGLLSVSAVARQVMFHISVVTADFHHQSATSVATTVTFHLHAALDIDHHRRCHRAHHSIKH